MGFPHLTESAYIKVRAALRQSVPPRVTSTWVMANVQGYTTELGARTLAGLLRRIGIINDDGAVTDAARQWRLDKSYTAGCAALLRHAFPDDLISALSGNVPGPEVLIPLSMSRGIGLQTARNVGKPLGVRLAGAAGGQAPTARSAPRQWSVHTAQQSARSPVAGAADETASEQHRLTSQVDHTGDVVLRYLLHGARVAELRIPRDVSTGEKRRMFKHLQIDLLDPDGAEPGSEAQGSAQPPLAQWVRSGERGRPTLHMP